MTRFDVSFCWDINASAAQKSSKQKSQHDDVAVALVQSYKLEHSGGDVVFMRVNTLKSCYAREGIMLFFDLVCPLTNSRCVIDCINNIL